jgi:SAM-dependent methyltransferase
MHPVHRVQGDVVTSAGSTIKQLADRAPDGLRQAVKRAIGRFPRPIRSIDAQGPLEPGAVDVRQLLEELSIEELGETADHYYRSQMDNRDYWHAKPFWHSSEVTEMTMSLGQILGGLRLSPGMRVLDFGAGSGWTSRIMAQLGCEVIVSDVSPAALELAEELFERLPILGTKPTPQFLRFDGTHIDLPDADVDRILCFDALHHTVNPEQVIAEMGRLLAPGGIAAFSEPGPEHSRGPQSQHEMKHYSVVENDILMGNIRDWAASAGFGEPQLAVFMTTPYLLDIEGYERLMANRSEAMAYLGHLRAALATRRIFFLRKHGLERADSRTRDGLDGELHVAVEVAPATGGSADRTLQCRFQATNTGTAHWLPSTSELGPVRIGVHLYDADDRLIDRDFGRISLPGSDAVAPGETISGEGSLTAPEPGTYVLEFDLVAESVTWFETNGSTPFRVPLTIDRDCRVVR